MAFHTKYTTSLFGRRLGLQRMSTAESGGASARGARDFIVGAEAVRAMHTTADTTSVNLPAYGISVLTTLVSSGVYTLDPPIPGVTKTLVFNTSAGTIYVKTGGQTIVSSQNSTAQVIKSTGTANACVDLVPLSTSVWIVKAASMSSATLALSETT